MQCYSSSPGQKSYNKELTSLVLSDHDTRFVNDPSELSEKEPVDWIENRRTLNWGRKG